MAVPIKLVLLICILKSVRAQFPEVDVGAIPQQRPRLPGRFLTRPISRSSTVSVRHPVISHQRIRRPISLKSKSPTDTNEFSIFTTVRPKSNFIPAIKSGNPSLPPPQLLQQDQPTKPVSEESKEEEEEDINQQVIKIGESGPAFFQPLNNLVTSSPLTPKPETIIQFRPSPTSIFNRPSQLQEENITPVQYRPKPVKFRKPIEEIAEIRTPVKHQQTQYHHSQQQQQQHQPHSQSLIKQSPKKVTSYREKKPVAQIIRRWREDNDDGSITWGFENDDGSYKEEIIGIDCVTRGKYGYVDPDGIRREYTYETGIKCDDEQQQDEQDNGFVDYQENKLVLPNGKTIDLSSMGKKQARRPQPIYRN